MREAKAPCGIIRYELVYKNIKRINIRAKSDGVLYISAPYEVSEEYICGLILKNSHRLLLYLENAAKAEERIQKGLEEAKGCYFYLGRKYPIEYIPSQIIRTELLADKITVYAPERAMTDKVLEILSEERAEALSHKAFEEVFKMLEPESLPKPSKITVKKMKTRWGSCIPSKGHISLNKELIYYPEGCLRYTILHELAHLRHRNHSKEFYAFIKKYMSNYKDYEAMLKKPYFEVAL